MNMKSTWRPVEPADELSAVRERTVEWRGNDEMAVIVSLLTFMVLFFYTVFVA